MKYLVSCFLTSLSFCAASQNLVPNPSFETFTTCPNGGGEIYYASSWIDPSSGSSDYFNECSTSIATVPLNFAGYRWPRTGKAYSGIILIDKTQSNIREYIQVRLSDSLVKGQIYCAGFYVSLSGIVQVACNSMSMYFSDLPINCAGCLFPYTPQINYQGAPISDTLKWILISGTFTALGGESYITIGNFNSDANTSTSIVNPTGSGGNEAYYYIDDVYVGTCDTLKPPEIISFLTVPNIFTPNNDGVNDVFKITQSNIQTLDCSIYDRWGVKLWELKNPDESWDGRNKAGVLCGDGVYYYVLTAAGLDGKKYALNGFLQLMR